MNPKLIVSEGRDWTPSEWAFGAVLGRVASRLALVDPLRTLLENMRQAGLGDLRGSSPARLATLLEATHTTYVRLVRVWRAGFPDEGHDELVEHTGTLIQLLEELVPQRLEDWSVRRLQAFGGSIDVCFPKQLQRTLLPLLRDDDGLAERVVVKLRDLDLDEERSALSAAAFLAPDARDRFYRDSAGHPREEVRYALFKLLARGRSLPEPGSLAANLPVEVADTILRAGVTDPSPRVRQRAIAYAYGLGRVVALRTELIAALDAPDPDETTRAYELLALGLLDDVETLPLLVRAFESGTQVEIDAAVWALARRNDGVARVVAAVEDPRPRVRSEALDAITHVAGALSDEQLAWLSAPERPAGAREAVQHHQRRKGVPDPAFRFEVMRSPT